MRCWAHLRVAIGMRDAEFYRLDREELAAVLHALEEREAGEAWRHAEVLYAGLAPHLHKKRLRVEDMVPARFRRRDHSQESDARLARLSAQIEGQDGNA